MIIFQRNSQIYVANIMLSDQCTICSVNIECQDCLKTWLNVQYRLRQSRWKCWFSSLSQALRLVWQYRHSLCIQHRHIAYSEHLAEQGKPHKTLTEGESSDAVHEASIAVDSDSSHDEDTTESFDHSSTLTLVPNALCRALHWALSVASETERLEPESPRNW